MTHPSERTRPRLDADFDGYPVHSAAIQLRTYSDPSHTIESFCRSNPHIFANKDMDKVAKVRVITSLLTLAFPSFKPRTFEIMTQGNPFPLDDAYMAIDKHVFDLAIGVACKEGMDIYATTFDEIAVDEYIQVIKEYQQVKIPS